MRSCAVCFWKFQAKPLRFCPASYICFTLSAGAVGDIFDVEPPRELVVHQGKNVTLECIIKPSSQCAWKVDAPDLTATGFLKSVVSGGIHSWEAQHWVLHICGVLYWTYSSSVLSWCTTSNTFRQLSRVSDVNILFKIWLGKKFHSFAFVAMRDSLRSALFAVRRPKINRL